MKTKTSGEAGKFAPVDYDPFAGPTLARVVPTTEPQREVWLADRLGREASLAYNESVSLRFSGTLNTDALRAALQDLVQRHEALRSTVSGNGENLCIAGGMVLDVPVADHGARGVPEQEATIAAARQRAVETPFDIEHGPLFRAEILKLAAADHLLIITAHHIVCDGWSFGVLVHDLAQLYAHRAGVAGNELHAPASFGDYALAQSASAGSPERAAHEAYWMSRFSGQIPTLDLPTDRKRSAWRTFTSRREDYVLDAGLVSEVRKTGSRNGAGLFAALLGSFTLLLQRIAGSNDVVVGIAAAGQSADGMGGLVGHCVHLLPVRIEVNPMAPMKAGIDATQSAMLDAYERQGYTYGTLLKKIVIERDPSRLPLVSVLFNIDQALDANTAGFPGVSVDFASNPRSYENFELFVNAVQVKGALRLECQFNADLFEGTTIRRWLACYETLLRAYCASADVPAGNVSLISSDDQRLLAQWNNTHQAFPRTVLVHELIEARASRAPERTAVTWQGIGLSYAALDARANRIAHALRARGIRRGDLVGLYLKRDPGMIAAVLAVLKAGAAYVPLDPSFPADRLAFMADDAGLSVLITGTSPASSVAWPRERTLFLDLDNAEITAQPETRLTRNSNSAEPEDRAYVIYTSGSTGKPKGVQVPHRAIVNFLEAMAREPGLSEDDRLVAVTTLSFDIAVTEILLPLAVGAEIVLAAQDDAADGAVLNTLIKDSRATIMQATPATWRLLLDAGWRGNRGFKALCGGETLNADLARQLLDRTGSVWNMYGPTETSVWSTCWHVTGIASGISIGRPIANTTVWILDEQRQHCPIGVPGEIWIGGDGVTSGYLNRPELTAERFVPDPYSASPGALLYRTGDRGRWRADGLLEHLGRLDFQVKVRGYRIELGEIEVCLASHPEVVQAVVIAREDRPGDVRLVAYLVAQPGTTLAEAALKAYLKAALPDYMIPQHLVTLPAIPLLPNGKIARISLPAPESSIKPAADYVAPRSDIEKSVVASMEEILSLPGIGMHDNFFALGGHSLLASQLASRLARGMGIQIPMRALFDTPTAAQLAAWVEKQSKAGGAARWTISRRSDRATAPLSAMQRRLWFLEQLDPGRPVYNTPSAHRLRGKLDEAAFARAFLEMVRRQDVLRTMIAIVDETPTQIILPEVPADLLPAEDLRNIPGQDRERVLFERLKALTAPPFDLAEPPLFRARLFRLDDEEYVFFFVAHHIIWDGWSFDLLYSDMATLYGAFRENRPSPLPDLAITYGDFAAWHGEWMRGRELAAELAHWKQRLAGRIEPLALPTDHPRPSVMTGRGDTRWISIPASTLDRVRELGRSADATLFMSLLAVYVLMLHQLTGQREIVVGTPVRGRQIAELEPIMGLFVNALPLRIRIAEDATFVSLLGEVRNCVRNAFAHPDVPLEQLVRELNPPRDRSRSPIYQAMFSFQDARRRIRRWGNLDHENIPIMQPGVVEDIGLWFMDLPDGLLGGLSYSMDILSEDTALLLRDRYLHLVHAVLAFSDTRISRLPLPQAEQRKLVSWNATETPFDREALAHSLIEAQARRSPDRTALSAGGETLSYAELDALANRLAHTLRARGVRRGERVGLCIERSIAMVVAQFAVLKSGGAYVPLDPAYPSERLGFMANDATLRLLLTESALTRLFDWPREQTLCIDADAAQIAAQPDTPPAADGGNARPEDTAYVIYTSGSTGKPKGVRVPHRAVVNCLSSMQREPGLEPDDRLVAVTTLSFDIAVLELLLPLASGAQVILASRDEALDAMALSRVIATNQASVMQATPTTWRMLLDAGWRGTPGFKVLIGGEALPPDLAARLLAAAGEVWNMYGPTETTVWSTCWRVEHPEQGITIGRPIENTQVWVLDDLGQRCPIGVPGEVWIGGDGVASGYLNRPKLTAERFISDPFSKSPGARLYRTGDRGRWRADGLLEHLGRLDFQVKIRGNRIELGEIEASLATHPGVAQTVVVTREDQPGEVRLVAYFVPRGVAPGASLLRDHVRKDLPVYMVPQHFVSLSSVPLLPNGKIDRHALPGPDQIAEPAGRSTHSEPQTDTEKLLAGIWCELLKIPHVSAGDNFFDAGGHSLLAMQAILAMEGKTGKRVNPARFIFETLGQIARSYDEAETEAKQKRRGLGRILSNLLGAGKA